MESKRTFTPPTNSRDALVLYLLANSDRGLNEFEIKGLNSSVERLAGLFGWNIQEDYIDYDVREFRLLLQTHPPEVRYKLQRMCTLLESKDINKLVSELLIETDLLNILGSGHEK